MTDFKGRTAASPRVEGDAAPARGRLLMCAPDHYGVDYIINPWMEENVGRIRRSLAAEQWARLRDLLSDAADLELARGEPGLPDMVFTANAGLAIDGKAVVSRFRVEQRRGEERLFKEWFEQHDFVVAPWPEDIAFEGAGDALLDRARAMIWCGYGFRSSRKAAARLEEIFARETQPLGLVDPRFYHLDTCFCPLSGGRVMYYPAAFDEESQRRVAAIVPPQDRIEVMEEDARAFACNAVEAAGRVLMNDASEGLQRRLRALGYEPVLTPLSEMIKAGGAAKCLTLNLSEH